MGYSLNSRLDALEAGARWQLNLRDAVSKPKKEFDYAELERKLRGFFLVQVRPRFDTPVSEVRRRVRSQLRQWDDFRAYLKRERWTEETLNEATEHELSWVMALSRAEHAAQLYGIYGSGFRPKYVDPLPGQDNGDE